MPDAMVPMSRQEEQLYIWVAHFSFLRPGKILSSNYRHIQRIFKGLKGREIRYQWVKQEIERSVGEACHGGVLATLAEPLDGDILRSIYQLFLYSCFFLEA